MRADLVGFAGRCSARGVSRRASARRRARGSRAAASSQSRGRRVRVGSRWRRSGACARDYVGPRGHRSPGRASHRRRAGDWRGSGDSGDGARDRGRGPRRAQLDAPAWVAPAIRASRELGADVPLVLAVCAQESALRAPAPLCGALGRRVGPDAVSRGHYAVARAFPRRWRDAALAARLVARRCGWTASAPPSSARGTRRGCWHCGRASPARGA